MLMTLYHLFLWVSRDEISLASWTENIQSLSSVFFALPGSSINPSVVGTTSGSKLITLIQFFGLIYLLAAFFPVTSKPTLILVFFLLITYLYKYAPLAQDVSS